MRQYKSERCTISLYRLPSDTERRQLWLCASLTRRCSQAPRVCPVSTFAEVMQPVLEPNLALGKWSASPKKRWTPFCKCTCRMNQLCLTETAAFQCRILHFTLWHQITNVEIKWMPFFPFLGLFHWQCSWKGFFTCSTDPGERKGDMGGCIATKACSRAETCARGRFSV